MWADAQRGRESQDRPPGWNRTPEKPHQQIQTLQPEEGDQSRGGKDGKSWETVGQPGQVDQQLLLLRHSKDEAEI